MLDIGFYCMGKKGLYVLENFEQRKDIKYVVGCRDTSIKNDYYEDIKNFCNSNNISFYDKNIGKSEIEDYKFAIGWRFLIEDYKNLIVLHDSPLPRYRGFAPVINMLINGESTLGVTALYASKDYDCGDILDQKIVNIEYPITIQQAIDLLLPLYSSLVNNVYNKLVSGKVEGTKQQEKFVSYSPWLDYNDYSIDWNWSAEKIKRFIDAVGEPYNGARAGHNVIYDAKVYDKNIKIENRNRHVGKVIFFNKNNPVVICGCGLLEILDSNPKITSIKTRLTSNTVT